MLFRSAVVDELKPSAIFHLAAQASVVASVEDPGRDCEVNVKGTLNVVEAAGRCAAPVVFTSTGGALYGDDAPMPTPEDRIPAPLSPYGASKWAAEAYVKTWSLSSGIPHAVCRLGNVYGPRQNPHGEAGVVAIFANKVLDAERPPIFGDGEQTRDFVYVDDVADAFVRAADKGGGLTINVATGAETSVQQLYDLIARNVGFEEPARYSPPRAGELRRSALDPGRAAIHLGWKPWTAIEDGVPRTIEWFRAARPTR